MICPQVLMALSFVVVTGIYTILDVYQPEFYRKLQLEPIPKNQIYTRKINEKFDENINMNKNENENENENENTSENENENEDIKKRFGWRQVWTDFIKKSWLKNSTITLFFFYILNNYLYDEHLTVLNWTQVLKELSAIWILSKVVFFVPHYLIHQNEFLYKHIHSFHHSYTRPIALTSIACTAEEMILLNLSTVLIPLIVIQPSYLVACIWSILVGMYVPMAHSGHYGGSYHDQHHLKPNSNFSN